MASIILTGATGTAGSAVLTTALASPLIAHVTVLARRAPAVTHAKLETIILPSDEYPGASFESIPAGVIDRLRARGSSAVVWALGVSQVDVDKDTYVKITHDYTLEAAKAFESLGTPDAPFRFVFVSSTSADQAEKSYPFYTKIKGRAEKWLAEHETDAFKTVNVRPAGIIPTPEHAHNVRWIQRTAISAMGWVMPSKVIQSTDLAKAAIGLAAGKGWEVRDEKEHWIDNLVLIKLAKAYDEEIAH
ncbi:hypothetical protein VHUM_01231 [Vanrija humicola]|uniref:NAD-dependent epimerase/dehydratase domain-containing protein n=1 Tax=Vanrija humicola TaxID=5417 RepID=A0A7D8Z239_VANHU|nr:hypothetical protein VHUM_01231 [Vanrija humicola]